MPKKLAILEKTKNQLNSYSLNKSAVPFPELATGKMKPPVSERELEDSSELFKIKEEEISWEEKARRKMDEYRKAERIIINNFYTGGGAYKKGIMDAIYRGFNPLNP